MDQNSPSIAKKFAIAYGLDPSTFDNCFSKLSDGTSKIQTSNLLSLSRQDFDVAESSLNFKLPTIQFGESELFYDIFESIFFQSGTVQRRIFSPVIFDEIVGTLVNNSKFPKTMNQNYSVTTNGEIGRAHV